MSHINCTGNKTFYLPIYLNLCFSNAFQSEMCAILVNKLVNNEMHWLPTEGTFLTDFWEWKPECQF